MATRKPAAKKPAVRKKAQVAANNPRQELKQALEQLHKFEMAKTINEALAQILKDVDYAKGLARDNAEVLERIETQVIATNGRVTGLEMWRNKSTGVMAAISVMFTILGWGISQVLGWWHK